MRNISYSKNIMRKKLVLHVLVISLFFISLFCVSYAEDTVKHELKDLNNLLQKSFDKKLKKFEKGKQKNPTAQKQGAPVLYIFFTIFGGILLLKYYHNIFHLLNQLTTVLQAPDNHALSDKIQALQSEIITLQKKEQITSELEKKIEKLKEQTDTNKVALKEVNQKIKSMKIMHNSTFEEMQYSSMQARCQTMWASYNTLSMWGKIGLPFLGITGCSGFLYLMYICGGLKFLKDKVFDFFGFRAYATLEVVTNSVGTINMQLGVLSNKIDDKEEKIIEVNTKLNETNNKLDEANNKFIQLQDGLNQSNRNIDETINTLKKSVDEIPTNLQQGEFTTLQNSFSDLEKQMSQRNNEFKQINDQLSEMTKKQEEIQKEYEDVCQKIKDILEISNTKILSDQENEKQIHETDLTSIKDSLKGLSNLFNVLFAMVLSLDNKVQKSKPSTNDLTSFLPQKPLSLPRNNQNRDFNSND